MEKIFGSDPDKPLKNIKSVETPCSCLCMMWSCATEAPPVPHYCSSGLAGDAAWAWIGPLELGSVGSSTMQVAAEKMAWWMHAFRWTCTREWKVLTSWTAHVRGMNKPCLWPEGMHWPGGQKRANHLRLIALTKKVFGPFLAVTFLCSQQEAKCCRLEKKWKSAEGP